MENDKPRDDAILSDTTLEACIVVVPYADDIESATLTLEESGFQRNFFTESRNKHNTFSTVVGAYSQLSLVNMKEAPEAGIIMVFQIRPGIFGGKSLFEIRVLTDGTDRPPQSTITAIEQAEIHHCCSEPTVSWTGSVHASQRLEEDGRALLADICRRYTSDITAFINEVVAFIRKSTIKIEGLEDDKEITEEEKNAIIEGLLQDDSRIWSYITREYKRQRKADEMKMEEKEEEKEKEKGSSLDTWMDIVKYYRELYSKVFHEHVTQSVDYGRFSMIFSVDFFDATTIAQVANPIYGQSLAVPRADDLGEHTQVVDLVKQWGDKMPNIRFGAVRHYHYLANETSTDTEHIYPYLRSSVTLYQAPDSSCIHFPNITTIFQSNDTAEWPSVKANLAWEDLAKSVGILHSDGRLFESEAIAESFGQTVSSRLCLSVASSVETRFDAWSSKLQAWPICKIHVTVIYPNEDTPDPSVVLDSARGHRLEEAERKNEEEEKKNYPKGTSLAITPEHMIVTVNVVERVVCARTNPKRVRQLMNIIAQERLDDARTTPPAMSPF